MHHRLAIIHTTPATIEPLKALASEMLPDYEVVNFVDDSILPQLARNGGDIREVEERWTSYARFAEQGGADVILSACSSVGELAARAQSHFREVQALASPRKALARARAIGRPVLVTGSLYLLADLYA